MHQLWASMPLSGRSTGSHVYRTFGHWPIRLHHRLIPRRQRWFERCRWGTRSWNRFLVILVIVIFMAAANGGMVDRRVVISRLICTILIRIPRRVLSGFPVFPSLHLGFFKQPLLLRQSLPFFAILDLVLSNQGLGRATKNTLVLAKLANPNIFNARGMVKVGILLLYLTLTRSQCIDTTRRPFLLPTRIGLFSARCVMGLLCLQWLRLGVSLIHLCGHAWTCLRPLGGEEAPVLCHGGKRRGGRAVGIGILCLQRHTLRRIRFAGKGKLSFRGRCGGSLAKQANIARTSRGR